jgi:hypothetical protein
VPIQLDALLRFTDRDFLKVEAYWPRPQRIALPAVKNSGWRTASVSRPVKRPRQQPDSANNSILPQASRESDGRPDFLAVKNRCEQQRQYHRVRNIKTGCFGNSKRQRTISGKSSTMSRRHGLDRRARLKDKTE